MNLFQCNANRLALQVGASGLHSHCEDTNRLMPCKTETEPLSLYVHWHSHSYDMDLDDVSA